MPNPAKTQAKMDKARARAAADTETARAKAERKITKVRADLAVTEAEIQGQLEKALEKGDKKLMAVEGAGRARAADRAPLESVDRPPRSKKR